MDIRERLSVRIHMADILSILNGPKDRVRLVEELYGLIYDIDDTVSYQAVWVLTHLSVQECKLLYAKQNQIIDEILRSTHEGKRRLLIRLLFDQPMQNPPRVDFLDFCFATIFVQKESPATRAFCIKVACKLCKPIPELLRELRAILEILDPELLPASIYVSRRDALKEIGKILK